MSSRTNSVHPDYQETIRRSAAGGRKYIRYFDGRGHFAHLQLHLTPSPGEPCKIVRCETVDIPEPCYEAAQALLSRKLLSGPLHGYPMFGFEIQVAGGTFLEKYSYPEAFARAAAMAWGDALSAAFPILMERYCGVTFKVDADAIKETLETLTRLLGDVTATVSWNEWKRYLVVQAETPIRRLQAVQRVFALRHLETYPLAGERQYRVLTGPPPERQQQSSSLDDWT
jgi:elongation factor G